jgi:hypothetical protein
LSHQRAPGSNDHEINPPLSSRYLIIISPRCLYSSIAKGSWLAATANSGILSYISDSNTAAVMTIVDAGSSPLLRYIVTPHNKQLSCQTDGSITLTTDFTSREQWSVQLSGSNWVIVNQLMGCYLISSGTTIACSSLTGNENKWTITKPTIVTLPATIDNMFIVATIVAVTVESFTGGNDLIDGGDGNECIGSIGQDTINGGSGSDIIFGDFGAWSNMYQSWGS